MKSRFLSLPSMLALALGGCTSATPPMATVPVALATPGAKSATVRVAPPSYATLALHKWVAADVFEYAVELQVQAGDGFVPLEPAVTAVLPQTGDSPTRAKQFTGLDSKVYRALVTARGNVGATDGAITLNATPASVTFDLTSAEAASGTATVAFDATPFDATAGGGISGPTGDGQWVAPADGPTIQIDTLD